MDKDTLREINNKALEATIRHSKYNNIDVNTFDVNNKKEWPDKFKELYKTIKLSIYNEERNNYNKRIKQRFLALIGKDNINQVLDKYGLEIYGNDGKIHMISDYIVRTYLENIVIPDLEKTFNIKGLRPSNGNVSQATQNIIDWLFVDFNFNETKE